MRLAAENIGLILFGALLASGIAALLLRAARRARSDARARADQAVAQLDRARETLVEFVRLNARLQRVQAALVDFSGSAGTEGVLRAFGAHASSADGAAQVVIVRIDRRQRRAEAQDTSGRHLATRDLDDEPIVLRVVNEQQMVSGAEGDGPDWMTDRAETWAAIPVIRSGAVYAVVVVAFAREIVAPHPELDTLQELARQAGAALERTLVVEALEESRRTMQHLSRQMIESEERERRHVSRELHDVLGSWLTSLRLGIAGMLADVRENEPVTVHALRECESTVERLLASVRSLSVELQPALLDEEGLSAAVRWHVERTSARAGFTAEFVDRTDGRRGERAIELTAFRIVQEALNNVVRHAEASVVRIVLESAGDDLLLEITDDGIGFDPHATREESLGLSSMQERVQIVGGVAAIESDPTRGGTTVRARLPYGVVTGGGELSAEA